MRARSFIWLLLGLLLLAGALYFWPAKSALPSATTPIPAVATANPVRPRLAATNHSVVSAANAPAFLTGQAASAPATPKPNPLAFRLSNTPKTSGQLLLDDRAILLENALIDTAAPLGFSIPQHLRAAAEPGSYIVQARGPVNAAFRSALTAAGGTIISYIPNNAYLVRLSAEGASRLFAGGVAQSVLPYEPVYKLKAELLQLAMEQRPLPSEARLNVMLFADLRAPTLREFQQAGAVVLDESASPFGPVITIQPGANWTSLAQLPGVAVIERVYPRVAANDLSRVQVGVASDSVVSSNYLNLTGEGVLVNLNDTGVDALHPDLTGRVIADFAAGLVDDNGHGTFVAGEIAGDGTVSATVSNAAGSLNPGVEGQYRGKAPQARIFAQSLDLSIGPASDGYLQTTAARTNAFISNNSWHYGNNNTYGMASASYDAAVRDALPGVTGSQPVLFIFAAGNAGDGADTGIGGDPGSIFAPGTAKNVLTVGATELPRDITNAVLINCTTTNIDGTNITSCETNYPWQGLTSSANEVAAFSSRGNVGRGIEGDFGRFKPDVVAPGTFVVSTRSTTWDEQAYYNPTSHFVVAFEGQFIQTNAFYYGDIFLPDNAVGFSLRLLNMTNLVSGAQVSALPIFVQINDYPVLDPPTYDFVRTNFVSVPPDGGGVGANVGQSWYYGVFNTTTQEVIFDIIHDIVVTNLYGNRLEVLSNLNNSISGTNPAAPQYYRYESGTSMAAADVSGTLALMQQFFQDRQITNSPAMMKALVINGARSAGSLYNFQVQNSINYQGWGLINLPNSLHGTLTNGINTPATNSMLLFDQRPATALATGQSQTWKISVSEAGRALPLRVTLVWTDPPGNPAAGVKLVNDLDLVVTNLDGPLNPIVYYGNDFPAGDPFTLATDTNAPPKIDLVNNVENVYITPSPLSLGTNYSITVSARRVNVNAVTAQTNNVVQDYALVISSGDGEVATLSLASISPPVAPAVATEVTLVTNLFSAGTFTSGSLIGQRVGANTPLLGTTNGMTNQWHFYIVTNNTTFTNASFLISASTDLSLPRIGVYQSTFLNATRRNADLDLYVSQDPALLQLSPAVIAVSDQSRSRNAENGDEAVIYDDSAQGQVYYIGVKSEDQMAGEFEFFAVFSLVPLAQEDADGYVQAYPFNPPQGSIPDGSPDKPGVSKWIAFLAGQGEVRRVIVTNSLLCENIADVVGAVVSPSQKAVVLNNHILPALPLAPGPYNFVYEDNDEGDVPGAIHPDGPGELRDFVGDAKGGQWKFYYVDNTLTATGRVDNCKIRVERQPGNGESITNTVPPNSWQYYAVNIPADATNLTVCLELISAIPQPLEIYLRKDEYPTSTAYDYTLTVNPPTGPPPGTCFSISRSDLPPLSPGRYFVGIFNGNPTSQTYVYTATYYTDPGSVVPIGWGSSGSQPLRDDAVTDSVITVTNDARIQQVEVGLRIDHPRVSDLAVTLVSPRGTRVLLAENRGGTSTEGFGTTISVTNIAPASSSGGPDAVTNVISTGVTSGSLTLDYNFFCAPDRMLMIYDGVTIFDSGLTNNGCPTSASVPRRVIIPFGPGVSTDITVVMNPGGNVDTNTAWNYTVSSINNNNSYLVFTEDPDLTTTPIKFAAPPLTSPPAGPPVAISGFDPPTLVGDYTSVSVPQPDNWTVLTTNPVTVVNTTADTLPQSLALRAGQMLRTVPTTPGRTYRLNYAYRKAGTLDGIVSWWPGGNSTTDIVDGNTGTLINGATYGPGIVGQGFEFDGSGDGVLVGNPLNLQMQDFTIEAWVRRASPTVVSIGSTSAEFFCYGIAGYAFGFLDDGRLFLSRVGIDQTQTAVAVTDTNFHHLAVTKSGTTVVFYIDGIAYPVPPYITTYTFSTPAAIGARGDDLSSSIFGTIDDLAIFNRPLSAAEIQQIYAAGAAGKCGMLTPPAVCGAALGAQVFVPGQVTNTFLGTTNWQPGGLIFTAGGVNTPVGLAPVNTNDDSGVLVDSFTLTEASGPRYVLPEESLSILRGENAQGDWTLELWDSRTGATNRVSLLSWEMQFVFQEVTPLPGILVPGLPSTNSVPPGQIAYFIVDVPAWAKFATNTLVYADGPLDVLFNQFTPPKDAVLPSYMLIGPGATTGQNAILSTTGTPPLLPGWRYYLGVSNPGPATVTYALQVDFDITALTNAVPVTSTLAAGALPRYFYYDVTPGATAVSFQLLGLSGNVNLVARRGAPLPTPTSFDYGSFNPGNNPEDIIVFTNSAPVPLTPGRWYLGVFNADAVAVTYTIVATEFTNQFPTIITLENGIPYANTNSGTGNGTDYYRYVVTPSAVRAQFEINGPSDDLTLVARRGLPLPDLTTYDYLSANAYTNDELIVVLTNSAPVALSPGNWFLSAVNISGVPVTYSIKATEWSAVEVTNLVIINYSFASNEFCLTWTSVPGGHYFVQGKPDLLVTNWTTLTPTITAVDYTTTWCLPLPSLFHYFRVGEGFVLGTYVPPPRIQSITYGTNGVTLRWNGPVTAQYNVQWTTTLVPPVWNTFTNVITSPTGLFEFLDDGTQSGGLGGPRFYRLLQLP